MATRISIGNGRYCYAGPNCRLHSARGVQTAQLAYVKAFETYSSAATLTELVTAKAELVKAQALYDATDQGQAALTKNIEAAEDVVFRRHYQKRLEEAKAYAEKLDSPESESVSDGVRDLPALGAASPEFERRFHRIDHETGQRQRWEGSNFAANSDLSVNEKAKKIRADLKEAQENGWLPRDAKFSVSVDKGSWTSSINVFIQGYTDASVREQIPGSTDPRDFRPSGNAREAQRRVEAIVDSYNSRNDMGIADEWSGSHHSYVRFETESGRAGRLEEAKIAKQRREMKPFRDAFVADARKGREHIWQHIVDADTYDNQLAVNGPNRFTAHDSGTVGRVEGTNTFVLVPEDDSKSLAVYDFSGSVLNDTDIIRIKESLKQRSGRAAAKKRLLRF